MESTGNKSSQRFDKVEPALHVSVLASIKSLGFETMTPVQAAVLPLFLGNKDVVAEVRIRCSRSK